MSRRQGLSSNLRYGKNFSGQQWVGIRNKTMFKGIVIAIIGLTLALPGYSQTCLDSGRVVTFPKTRLGRVVVVSAPLIAEGLVAKKLDGRFIGLRNDYIPGFKKSVTNICNIPRLR